MDPVKMPVNDDIQHVELPIILKGARAGRGEMVEVEAAPNARFTVFEAPAFVEGLAVGDVFELAPEELSGFKVTYHSGNLTIWLMLPEGAVYREEDRPGLDAVIGELGGVFDGCAVKKILIFSVHVTAMFDQIEKLMERLTEKYPGSTWQYGNVYDWENKPLNWWQQKPDRPNMESGEIDFNHFDLP
ncbi:MAG: DUF4265 domain-containing protein [Candidatus Obscuribacterales bacterium]|nr:DUF4265 domain-containing protein [Candidatus Obscuribacterales bacterium]